VEHDQLVTLNARGTLVATRRDTLRLAPCNSVLGSLVAADDEMQFAQPPIVNGAYFIDVVADDLHAILDVLVMARAPPTQEKREHLMHVAQYLNLTPVINTLAPRTVVFMVNSLKARKLLPFDAAHPVGTKESFVPVRVPLSATVRQLNHLVGDVTKTSFRASVFLCKVKRHDRLFPRTLVDLAGKDADVPIADCFYQEPQDEVAAWLVKKWGCAKHQAAPFRLPVRKSVTDSECATILLQFFSSNGVGCKHGACHIVRSESTISVELGHYIESRGLIPDNAHAYITVSRAPPPLKIDLDTIWNTYNVHSGMVVTICHADDADILVQLLRN